MAFGISAAAAGLIGGGLGALGSVGGAAIGASAAGSAADKQAAAAAQANQLQKQIYDQQRADQEPYRQAGMGALSQMQDPSFQHNFGMSDYQADPGYQFRLDQGQKALERSAAARGGLQSGGTLKGLTDYAQGMASQEYQGAYNRFTNNQNNRFGRLSTIAGMGQGANSANAAAGQNYAGQVGGNMTGVGNAQGAASIASGNTWGNTLSGLGSGLGKSFGDAYALSKQPNWLAGMGTPFGSSLPSGPQAPSLGLSGLGTMPTYNF